MSLIDIERYIGGNLLLFVGILLLAASCGRKKQYLQFVGLFVITSGAVAWFVFQGRIKGWPDFQSSGLISAYAGLAAGWILGRISARILPTKPKTSLAEGVAATRQSMDHVARIKRDSEALRKERRPTGE